MQKLSISDESKEKTIQFFIYFFGLFFGVIAIIVLVPIAFLSYLYTNIKFKIEDKIYQLRKKLKRWL
jgi:hypothetical protein